MAQMLERIWHAFEECLKRAFLSFEASKVDLEDLAGNSCSHRPQRRIIPDQTIPLPPVCIATD